MNDDQETTPPHSDDKRSVIVTLSQAGATVVIDKGVSAFELFGIVGILETQARIMQTKGMIDQQRSGLVIPQ